MNRLALPAMTLALVGSLALAACEERSERPKTTAPTASALAPSKSDSAKAEKWTVSEAANVTFEMAGKLENIKGKITKARGELQLDLSDLTSTRGVIELDMTTLSTHTFGEAGKDTKQTADALTWLEVSDSVDGKLKKEHQWASFAIRSIGSAEPRDLTALTGDERTAKIKASGDLLLHGHKSAHDVELDVEFTMTGGEGTKVKFKTSKPMTIALDAHKVEPRDDVGKLVGWAVNNVLRDKVAESAAVSFELGASIARGGPKAE